MDLLFWGMTLSIAGEVFIGVAVVNVHRHIAREHRIDRDVLMAMRRERRVAVTGIVLLIIGYVIQLYAEGYFSAFMGA